MRGGGEDREGADVVDVKKAYPLADIRLRD
jgi:hypothetical protein